MPLEGFDRLIGKLKDELPTQAQKEAAKIIGLNARALQRYIRQERMTGGTTETKLHTRSGRLRGSVIPIPVNTTSSGVEGGVSIGTIYGRVHIGPRGQKTVIKPKKGKWLTIPLPAALTSAGVLKGNARSNIWGDTFIAKTAKGRYIIFGKRRIMKGKREGQLRGAIIPLFMLMKQVTVPARIDPEDLIAWVKPRMVEAFQNWRFKG